MGYGNTAQAVVNADLEYICRGWNPNLPPWLASDLLIVGGAGFLGYYLVQSILHWNERS